MNSSKELQEWDTNYGWWTDKPERNARLGSNAERYPAAVNRSERVE